MLIRRHIDPAKTIYKTDRHLPPTFSCDAQWIQVDPWEPNECIDAMALVCCVPPEQIKFVGWNALPLLRLVLPPEQKLVCVAVDEESSLCYFRRPVDIERLLKWNVDRSFRIAADQWLARKEAS